MAPYYYVTERIRRCAKLNKITLKSNRDRLERGNDRTRVSALN